MMAEYIEREALIAAYDKAHKGPPGGARKLMEEAPAVDVVPVVRCGECKYFYNLTCKIRKGSWGEQLKVGFADFCSDGYRRDSDGK